MMKILLLVVLAVTLAGCDAVEGMRDTMDIQEEVKGIIEEATGAESQVRFGFKGDKLSEVSVSLAAGEVSDKRVAEVEELVRYAVSQAFEEVPQVIYIQLVTTGQPASNYQ